MFDETNFWVTTDTPVINAMGELLVIWKSPEITESLIERMSKLDDAWRAEAVLRAMGASGPVGAGVKPADNIRPKGSEVMWKTTQQAYAAWYRPIKPLWAKTSGGGLAQIKGLEPQHIAAPVPLEQIDPDDLSWHHELEVGWPKIRSFDLAFCLDVLVHFERGSESAAIAELARILKPGGRMVIRVSALDALHSRHSTFTHERQRFTRRRLVEVVEAHGIRVLRCTYANSLLMPVALARFRIWEPLTGAAPQSGTAPVPRWLDKLLYLPLAIEAKCIGWGIDFPLGQSLILVGEKA
jgi:SAM-dependent methyltransferase